MRTSVSKNIAAPRALVFALASEAERWPSLLPHYERAQVVDRGRDGSAVIVFVARRELVPLVGLGIPVAWRSRVRADADASAIHFRHLGGATDGMVVTWRIEETAEGCRVTIEHDFGEQADALGRLRTLAVDRLFVRPVAGRTLTSFRAIAEAVAAAVGHSGDSAAQRRTGTAS